MSYFGNFFAVGAAAAVSLAIDPPVATIGVTPQGATLTAGGINLDTAVAGDFTVAGSSAGLTYDQTTHVLNYPVPAGLAEYDVVHTATGATTHIVVQPVAVAASDVRYGATAGDGTAGTCRVPTAAQTLLGVPVDNGVGTVRQAPTNRVLSPTVYGPSDSLTGTASGGGGPTPTDPGSIVGVGVTRDTSGNVRPATPVTFKMKTGPGIDGNVVNASEQVFTSDGSGNLNAQLIKGAVYKMWSGQTGTSVTVNVPASGTSFVLPEVLLRI